MAFIGVSIIENRVNGIKKMTPQFKTVYITIAAIGLVVALTAFILPERKSSLIKLVEDVNVIKSAKLDYMTADELSFRIMNDDKKLQIIDFRPAKEYEKFNLPKSTLFLIDNLFEKEPNKLLTISHKVNVFVANDEISEKKMAIIASELGYKNIRILKGGLNEFKNQLYNTQITCDTTNQEGRDTYRFRMRASQLLPKLIEQNKTAGPVKKTQKRVVGGC